MTNFSLPKTITPDPIIDSVVEIRFNSPLPEDKVFGLLFNALSQYYPKYKKISNTIPVITGINISKFTPDIRLENEEFTIGIGSNVVLYRCIGGYKGWQKYFSGIKRDIEMLFNEGVLGNSMERIGIRYVNYFEEIDDISKHIELTIKFSEKEDYITQQTTYRTVLSKNNISHTLSVADKISMPNKHKGSLIDIDSSRSNFEFSNKEDLFNIIDEIHKEEKILFFSLLKKDFLQTLNPTY